MHDISVTMRDNSVTTKVTFFLGGREDVLPPRLQCDAARGESISEWMLLRRRGGESVYRLTRYARAEAGETPPRAHPLSPEGTHYA